MLISVVIPVYNVEKYLRQCLDSVINQTYSNLEIICVDDCSTDSSLEILKEYAQKDPRVKIVCNKENVGLGLTRNVGLKIATGEYVHCLDSDDWLELYAYEELVKTIESYPTVEIIHFKYKLYSENGGTTNFFPVFAPDKPFINKLTNLEINPEIMRLWTSSAWLKLIKRKFIIDNQIFYNDYKCLEDIAYSLEIILKAKNIVFLSVPFITYRTGREDSLMNKRFNYLDNIIKDAKWAEKNSDNLPEISRKAYLYYIYSLIITNYHDAYNNGKIVAEKIKEILLNNIDKAVIINNPIFETNQCYTMYNALTKEKD